jgi:hypothetical protein
MKVVLLLAFALLAFSVSSAEDEQETARNDMDDELPDVVYGEELCCMGFAVLPAVLLLSAQAHSSYGTVR